jgi:branched-chain amino acid aminotransferase
MLVYLNGNLVREEEAAVSVFDHGLLYGDGIFEGIRTYEGNVFRLSEHIARLYDSARAVLLEIPLEPEELEQAVLQTVAANGLRDNYIRLLVTRGAGELGIDPATCRNPNIVIIVKPVSIFPREAYEEGVPVITASTRRIPLDCLDPRIKSLNYLNNILARLEAKRANVPEAIMLNQQGRVAEGTTDNIFILKGGNLLTPPVTEGVLPGVTRATLLEIARELGIPARESSLAAHDLYTAEECFLSGTGVEIVPVISVDGRQIGSGAPGPVTRRLMKRFAEVRVRDGRKVDYTARPSGREVEEPRIASR